MKFTFGRVKEDGSKACYLKRLEGKIFVCWFTPEDMITKTGGIYESPTQAVCQMIRNAGYNGLQDYWKTNINKIIK
jgi:hypothetical protein